MAKREKRSGFYDIVKNKKLPILTLDNRWHELFDEENKTAEIRNLEQKVNNLLKRQGKLVNDIKDLKKLKSNLLQEIVQNMDVSSDKAKEKKLSKNKQYVEEINEKLDAYMDELGDLPYQIREVNEQLMVETIHAFYSRLDSNREELKEVMEWINKTREELKQKILLKQDLEAKNTKIYTYMHDILGAGLMEDFDSEHNGD